MNQSVRGLLMSFSAELSDDDICLEIMQKHDFESLYNVAKDSEIWSQHNDKERCKLEGFRSFFEEGMSNPQNCFLIFHKRELVGSTRYYQYSLSQSSLKIGYTFYATKYWGTTLNKRVKKIMLDYAFKFVDNVFFDVWHKNFRSQKAVEKLGAKFHTEENDGEKYSFLLTKEIWEK